MLRTAVTIAVATAVAVGLFTAAVSVSAQEPGSEECPLEWKADGYCDTCLNKASYDYDGGDCCEETCKDDDGDTIPYHCGVSAPYQCIDSAVMTWLPSNGYRITANYRGFELQLICDRDVKAGHATEFAYTLHKDKNNLERKPSGDYWTDEQVPEECRPKNGKSFRGNPRQYDRGHQVAAEHLDSDKDTMYDSHYATNILPQHKGLNQAKGAWFRLENMLTCIRDNSDRVVTFGGALYNKKTFKDTERYLQSHGVRVPDRQWRVIVRYPSASSEKPVVGAWVMNNTADASREKVYKSWLSNKGFYITPQDLLEEVGKSGGDISGFAKYLPKKYDLIGMTEDRAWQHCNPDEVDKVPFKTWKKEADKTKERSTPFVPHEDL